MSLGRLIKCISVTALMGSSIVLAADLHDLMNQGDNAYSGGNYQPAVTIYEQIMSSGKTSAALEYNLGNAYFKLNQIGNAILHFERAHKLAPRDPDIRFNLNYAKLFRKDQLDLPQRSNVVIWFENVRQYLTLNELSLITLGLWLLLIPASLFYWIKRGRGRGKLAFYIFLSAGILFILAAGWTIDRYRIISRARIVVMAEESEVHSAPVESSKTLFILHEGMEGRLEEETDGWLELKLADGKVGWIQLETVAQI